MEPDKKYAGHWGDWSASVDLVEHAGDTLLIVHLRDIAPRLVAQRIERGARLQADPMPRKQDGAEGDKTT